MIITRNDGRTYEVDCYVVPLWEIAVAVHGQKCIALNFRAELARELLRRDLCHRWLAVWELHLIVSVVSHLEIS